MSVEHVRAFDTRREEGERLYLLLDPLTDHDEAGPLSRAALVQLLGEDAVMIVPREDLAHSTHACPILADLSSAADEVRRALLETSAAQAADEAARSRRYVCGWLISALDPASLALYLAGMHGMGDASGRNHFFPIHEPLRLELLAAADMAYATQRLGPVREWLVPGSHGGVVLLKGAANGEGPRSLTPIALEALDEAPRVAAVLAAWRGALRSNASGALLPRNAARDAFVQIHRAKTQSRLRDHDDIATLAINGVIRHPRLHESPEVAALIERAARGEAPLADLFSTLHDARWTYIVSGLSPASTAP